MKITKAVIPAAGFGTRFLPQTKAMPKEMLPIVDKPIIQIIVEELVEAGITDIVIVTGWHKRAIEDHFDKHPELEALLELSGKTKMLEEVRRINALANFIYVRQKGPLGNAVPLFNSLTVVNNEPFVAPWGDDLITASPSRTQQLINAYHKYGGTILGAIKTDNEKDTKRFGYAKGKEVAPGVIEVSEVVEKPGPGMAPSNLAVVSGNLFTPEVFPYLEQAVKNISGREPNYIDALSAMIKNKKGKVYAIELENARYFDCGSKSGYLEAIIEFGLIHPETKDNLLQYLQNRK